MKLFLDTANQAEVEAAVKMGVISGVTTNPSLVAKEGGDYIERVKYFCELVGGPISVEVMAADTEGMLAEARELAALHENIVIKLPITAESLAAIKQLKAEGIKTNATLCFSANQAILAARAGASYVSPFVGRLNDVGMDGMGLIAEIKAIFDNYDIDTEIIVASVRSPRQVTDAAMIGADIATIPFKTLEQMVSHPQTDLGIAKFESDWAKRK
ncbi:MAG: fructose-6-phosphate aldolase [Peptococcaceae bacterium]|nr:fructose-6-phosphate aldolase [Peptococcaceae bacterium]MBO5115084.1 fructose-6-phosphate aldolase [Peptococcaceae bacterium]MBO5140849.1 fructose-6-phosphate aldolase [Peptococcaceae bacterium]MBO5428395.1 fructose-6-phosphate aldolase [Peptococcaceae bacterium]MBP3341309.1 fructose-6-phosphate aldolase [Peptococcaceae bacterium]